MKKITLVMKTIWDIYCQSTLVGVVRFLRYKLSLTDARTTTKKRMTSHLTGGMGLVGAGSYVVSVHLPCLRALKQPIYAVMSKSGHSALVLSDIYQIGTVFFSLEDMLASPGCDSLLIATPHYLHPLNIITALNSGLHVYCEKPVAIDAGGLRLLVEQGLTHPAVDKMMVGFNRRFAPAVLKLKSTPWLRGRINALEIHYRVNFGPRVENMMTDITKGGGRIHGAACHYVDLIAFIAGESIVEVAAMGIEDGDENSFVAIMKLNDGSLASLVFTSEGDRRHDAKEEIMISVGGNTARIKNFSYLELNGKGHRFYRHTFGAMSAMQAFLHAKKEKLPMPVSLCDGIVATSVTLAIQRSIQSGGQPHKLPVLTTDCQR
jgi:predicted dehydrogenase